MNIQCRIQREFMFLICTALCYTTDIASACACLMNCWRLALCPSVTVPLEKRGTSPSHAKLWPTVYIVTVWRHCMAKTWVYFTSWYSGCNGTANDIPQDLSTFSQQISPFPLSSYLSSWIKQGTSSDVSSASSDVSSTSANFVVQPRLLRRFCWRAMLNADRRQSLIHQCAAMADRTSGWFTITKTACYWFMR